MPWDKCMYLGLSSEEAKLRLLMGIQNKEFWGQEGCCINSIVQDWLKNSRSRPPPKIWSNIFIFRKYSACRGTVEMNSVGFFQSMTFWGIHSSCLSAFLCHQQGQILSFLKLTNEVSMQLLVSRSLEIQGNAFGAKSRVLMTGWHVMIIHSGAVLWHLLWLCFIWRSEVVQESPVRKTKPLKLFWLGGRT